MAALKACALSLRAGLSCLILLVGWVPIGFATPMSVNFIEVVDLQHNTAWHYSDCEFGFHNLTWPEQDANYLYASCAQSPENIPISFQARSGAVIYEELQINDEAWFGCRLVRYARSHSYEWAQVECGSAVEFASGFE